MFILQISFFLMLKNFNTSMYFSKNTKTVHLQILTPK